MLYAQLSAMVTGQLGVTMSGDNCLRGEHGEGIRRIPMLRVLRLRASRPMAAPAPSTLLWLRPLGLPEQGVRLCICESLPSQSLQGRESSHCERDSGFHTSLTLHSARSVIRTRLAASTGFRSRAARCVRLQSVVLACDHWIGNSAVACSPSPDRLSAEQTTVFPLRSR
jgi:hypothetical protein